MLRMERICSHEGCTNYQSKEEFVLVMGQSVNKTCSHEGCTTLRQTSCQTGDKGSIKHGAKDALQISEAHSTKGRSGSGGREFPTTSPLLNLWFLSAVGQVYGRAINSKSKVMDEK